MNRAIIQAIHLHYHELIPNGMPPVNVRAAKPREMATVIGQVAVDRITYWVMRSKVNGDVIWEEKAE